MHKKVIYNYSMVCIYIYTYIICHSVLAVRQLVTTTQITDVAGWIVVYLPTCLESEKIFSKIVIFDNLESRLHVY